LNGAPDSTVIKSDSQLLLLSPSKHMDFFVEPDVGFIYLFTKVTIGVTAVYLYVQELTNPESREAF